MNYMYSLFLYFFIYSVLGWLTEEIYCRLCEGRWTNRGFLYGPYCPIYGFGGILVIIFLEPYYNNPIIIFSLACLLTTTLEYITSFLMEKLFDAKWWDYSHLPFNIKGRVCLLNTVLFGILGLFITYIIHPNISNIVSQIPNSYLPYIVFAIFIALVVDLICTLNTIFNLKFKLIYLSEIKNKIQLKTNSNIQNSELIKQLEDLKIDFINKKDMLKNRLINAFPNMEMPKFNEAFDELKLAIHTYRTDKRNKVNKK